MLDDFPTNLQQAVKLESSLTGMPIEVKESKVHGLTVEYAKEKGRDKKSKNQLAANPRPPPPAHEPASYFDVVILFDLDDMTCMKRANGRFVGIILLLQGHFSFSVIIFLFSRSSF